MIQFDYLSMKNMMTDDLIKTLTAEKFSQFDRLLDLMSIQISHNEDDSKHAVTERECCR